MDDRYSVHGIQWSGERGGEEWGKKERGTEGVRESEEQGGGGGVREAREGERGKEGGVISH